MRAHRPAELHGDAAAAAARSSHEQPFASLELGLSLQRSDDCCIHSGQRCRFNQIEVARCWCQSGCRNSTNSAMAPNVMSGRRPHTRSSGIKFATPAPTLTTSPAKSTPEPLGKFSAGNHRDFSGSDHGLAAADACAMYFN